LGGEYSIALGIHKDILDKEKCTDLLETDDYYEFPFCKYTRLFCDFLLSSTDKELQKNYDLLLDTVLKEADKRRK
jgi:coproporphyrinogen III oxidase-like Fe-S oxidoreductase